MRGLVPAGRTQSLWWTLRRPGSLLCLTTAVDYSDMADDAGGIGGMDMYVASISEGVACLAGKAATQALRDIVVANATMLVKSTILDASTAISDLDSYLKTAGGPPTRRSHPGTPVGRRCRVCVPLGAQLTRLPLHGRRARDPSRRRQLRQDQTRPQTSVLPHSSRLRPTLRRSVSSRSRRRATRPSD